MNYILMLVVFSLSTSAYSQSLVVNGDFENGDTGFATEFTQAEVITPPETYVITTDPNVNHSRGASYGDNTTGNGLMMAVNGTTTPPKIIWEQDVAVQPQSSYKLRFSSSTWFARGSIQISINDQILEPTIDTPSDTSLWEEHTFDWNSGDNETAKISLTNISSQFTGNDFAIDDISLTENNNSVDTGSNGGGGGTIGLYILGLLLIGRWAFKVRVDQDV